MISRFPNELLSNKIVAFKIVVFQYQKVMNCRKLLLNTTFWISLVLVQTVGSSTSTCIYRDREPMPPDIFSIWACHGCYDYWMSRYDDISLEIPVKFCQLDGYKIPCHNETVYFDCKDEEMRSVIEETMSDFDVEKWLACAKAADKCCSRLQNQQPSEGKCPALWDGWECWDDTNPGTVAIASCPHYIYSGAEHSCDLHSNKECFGNATWNVQTDYNTCSMAPWLRLRHEYHVAMLSTAIVLCLPALVIFIACKRLYSTRVFLHRNLLISIVLRNTLVILSKSLIIIDELYATEAEDSNMQLNRTWCKILTALEKLATNSVFACMALESVYLHRVLARSFRGQPNMIPYYIIAAALSVICAGTWSAVMAVYSDEFCWTVDVSDLELQWINDSLRIALLIINFLLLCDIVRVLLTRLKKVQNAQSSRMRRTAKATLFLAPVFGVQFLFTAIRPSTRDCYGEQAYYLVAYSLEALQGPLVALLYCYMNREVRQILRGSWERRFGPLRKSKPRPSFVTDVTVLQGPNQGQTDT